MTHRFAVHSLHFNVDQGDCAIHLLVEESQQLHTQGQLVSQIQRKIHRATLIDGGCKINYLHRVYAFIQGGFKEWYEIHGDDQVDKDILKFDSVVVTHWDRDHYWGIVQLFTMEYLEHLNSADGKLPATALAASGLHNTVVIPGYQSRIMKYDGSIPLTVFYAPGQKSKCYLSSNTLPRPTSGNSDDKLHGLNFLVAGATVRDPDLGPDGMRKVNIVLQDMCCYASTPEEIIGVDLLTNCYLPSSQPYYTLDTRRKLLSVHEILYGGTGYPVGIFCLSSHRNVIGRDTTLPDPGVNVTSHLGKGIDRVIELPTSITNQSSIGAVVLWKTTGRITHFFAGDADYQKELYMMHWIKDQDPAIPNRADLIGLDEITCLKLSHHGASSSTAVQLLTQCQPKVIFVSAGTHKGHNHPRWETIFYLGAHALRETSPPNLVATMYPVHYLASSNNNFSISAYATDRGVAYDNFRKGIDDIIKHWDQKDPIMTQIDAITNRKRWIKEKVCQIWTEYGKYPTDPCQDPTACSFVFLLTHDREELMNSGDRPWCGWGWINHGFASNTFNLTQQMEQRIAALQSADTLFSIDQEDLEYDSEAEQAETEDVMTVETMLKEAETIDDIDTPREVKNLAFVSMRSKKIKKRFQRPIKTYNLRSRKKKQLDPFGKSVAERDRALSVNPRGDNVDEAVTGTRSGPFFILSNYLPRRYIDYHEPLMTNDNIALLDLVDPQLQPLDSILSGLHRRKLILEDKPTPSAELNLYNQDEWFCWLKDVVSAVEFKARTGSTSALHIENFTVTLDFHKLLQPHKNITVNTSGPDKIDWENNPSTDLNQILVEFRTEFFTHTCGINGKDGSPLTLPLGVLQSSNTIAFGIGPISDAAPPIKSTLTEVIGYLYLEDYLSSPLVNLLASKTGIVNLTLDTRHGSRNVLWFSPDEAYLTTLRLQWEIDAVDTIRDLFKELKMDDALDIESVHLITRQSSRHELQKPADSLQAMPMEARKGEIILSVKLKIAGRRFQAAFVLAKDTLRVELSTKETLTKELGTWLGKKAPTEIPLLETVAGFVGNVLEHVHLRRIGFDLILKKEKKSMANFKVHLEVGYRFGSDEESTVPLLLTYQHTFGGQGGKFIGNVWLDPFGYIIDPVLLPQWEECQNIQPITSEYLPRLDLKKLLQKQHKGKEVIFPQGVPHTIDSLFVEIDKHGFTFYGAMTSDPPASGPVPSLSLDFISLRVGYDFQARSLAVELNVEVELMPPGVKNMDPALPTATDEQTDDPEAAGADDSTQHLVNCRFKDAKPAMLEGILQYNSGSKSWHLGARIGNLQASVLYNLFDNSAKDGVLEMLGFLTLQELSMDYNYTNGVGSGFTINGLLNLGKVELGAEYAYHSDGGWEFKASLAAGSDADSTVGDVLASILGEESPDEDFLPEFIASIPIKGRSGASGNRSIGISLTCKRVPIANSKKAGESAGNARGSDPGVPEEPSPRKPESINESKDSDIILFTLSLDIGGFSASYVQFQAVGRKNEGPKRIFKASVGGLQKEIEAPIVGKISQPMDELVFLWISDNGHKESTTGRDPGLSAIEVDTINTGLKEDAQILIKKTKPEEVRQTDKTSTRKPQSTDVVLEAGCHFMVVLKEGGTRTVVLDYPFAGESKESEKGVVVVSKERSEAEGDGPTKKFKAFDDPVPTPAGGGKTGAKMAPYKKQLGPISLSNIGCKYENKQLTILLDAAFLLGPVDFRMIGAGFTIDISGGIHQLPSEMPKFSLQGLAVSFNRPPVQVSGMYMHVVTPNNYECYVGGVTVGLEPYLFQATGFYGERDGSKSIFVFGRVEGPIMTLSFATISGLTGGFGYNVSMTLPTAADVPSFPLIASGSTQSQHGGQSITETLAHLLTPREGGRKEPWFQPREGSFWLAAGLKVTAMEILKVDAVAVVSWDPEIKFGIFGVAVADFPKGQGAPIGHIELGIAATVDFSHGVMKFEGQLSPSSYLLSKNCHLTGGFALCYWFKGGKHSQKALEGDWVFTIGGYHPAYVKPAHYPNPPRVAISWQVDSSISITGEAYFAITPTCCMCGGRLVATLNTGPLRAWFITHADFLINYKPFSFVADGSVTVGVSCLVDLWLTSFTVRAEIGADLHLEGPPLCGRIHVNFWVMGFNVNFGPNPDKVPDKLSLIEFYNLVTQTNSKLLSIQNYKDSSNDTLIEVEHVDANAHLFSCTSGLVVRREEKVKSQGESTTDEIWAVRAGDFAFEVTSHFAISEATVDWHDTIENGQAVPSASAGPIYARPMQLTQTQKLQSEFTVKVEKLSQAVNDGGKKPQWKVAGFTKPSPRALWDAYDSATDPAKVRGGNNRLLTEAGNHDQRPTIPMLMGVQVSPPDTTYPPHDIPKFNVEKAMSVAVPSQDGKKPKLPKIERTISSKWVPHVLEDTGNEQWSKVKGVWKKPVAGMNVRNAAVRLWEDKMSWKCGGLDLRREPQKLFSRFGDLYMVAPQLSMIDAEQVYL